MNEHEPWNLNNVIQDLQQPGHFPRGKETGFRGRDRILLSQVYGGMCRDVDSVTDADSDALILRAVLLCLMAPLDNLGQLS